MEARKHFADNLKNLFKKYIFKKIFLPASRRPRIDSFENSPKVTALLRQGMMELAVCIISAPTPAPTSAAKQLAAGGQIDGGLKFYLIKF